MAFKDVVFHALHDDLGHQGRDRTISLVKQRFFWSGMDADKQDRVRQCERCILRKTRQEKAAKLINIVSSAPMEVVCLDYLSLEQHIGHNRSLFSVRASHPNTESDGSNDSQGVVR